MERQQDFLQADQFCGSDPEGAAGSVRADVSEANLLDCV
jgi:hypothetical protein